MEGETLFCYPSNHLFQLFFDPSIVLAYLDLLLTRVLYPPVQAFREGQVATGQRSVSSDKRSRLDWDYRQPESCIKIPTAEVHPKFRSASISEPVYSHVARPDHCFVMEYLFISIPGIMS